MMFHPKHVLIKDEFQKHRMDHQSDILLRAATKFRYYYYYYYYYYYCYLPIYFCLLITRLAIKPVNFSAVFFIFDLCVVVFHPPVRPFYVSSFRDMRKLLLFCLSSRGFSVVCRTTGCRCYIRGSLEKKF